MRFAKKSLGQNFLIDQNIVKKIVNLVEINNRNVIEIGPGKGALTDMILQKKPKFLTLIEKDNSETESSNVFFIVEFIFIYFNIIIISNL